MFEISYKNKTENIRFPVVILNKILSAIHAPHVPGFYFCMSSMMMSYRSNFLRLAFDILSFIQKVIFIFDAFMWKFPCSLIATDFFLEYS